MRKFNGVVWTPFAMDGDPRAALLTNPGADLAHLGKIAPTLFADCSRQVPQLLRGLVLHGDIFAVGNELVVTGAMQQVDAELVHAKAIVEADITTLRMAYLDVAI